METKTKELETEVALQAAKEDKEKEEEQEEQGEGEEPGQAREDQEIWCDICFKTFRSKQAMAAHKQCAHRIYNDGWSYVGDEEEGLRYACQTKFWSKRRLVLHWVKQKHCLAATKEWKEPGDPAEALAQAKEEEASNPMIMVRPPEKLGM